MKFNRSRLQFIIFMRCAYGELYKPKTDSEVESLEQLQRLELLEKDGVSDKWILTRRGKMWSDKILAVPLPDIANAVED